MKKILLLLTLTAVMCIVCACGGGADADTEIPNDSSSAVTDEYDNIPEGTDASEPEATHQNASYTLAFEDGKTFEMGKGIEDVVAIYGEWMYYAEAPSCIHPGMDKIYTFDGFDMTTSPDANGRDCIYEIAITSDAVVIDGGLTIGSSRDTMESIFGADYTEQFGVVRYILDEVSVSVVLNGDFITSLVITVNW